MSGEVKREDPAEAGGDDGLFLLMRRDLYYRPNAMGYTGIKDHAGRYTKAEAESHADPISGVTAIAAIDAPDFSPACFDDLARAHLLGKLEQATRELSALRAHPQAREDDSGRPIEATWTDGATHAYVNLSAALSAESQAWRQKLGLRIASVRYLDVEVPPDREDAQPVAWERRWSRRGERKTKDHTPKGWNLYAVTRDKLLSDDEPLFAHPAPDALRVAVEALEQTRDRIQTWPIDDHEICMCGSTVSSHDIGSGHSPVSQADHAVSTIVEEINKALAALQAEQDSKS